MSAKHNIFVIAVIKIINRISFHYVSPPYKNLINYTEHYNSCIKIVNKNLKDYIILLNLHKYCLIYK